MLTGRSLTVCWSLLPGGGRICLVRGGGCVCLVRGVCLFRGGGGGGGVCLVQGGYIPACTEADTPRLKSASGGVCLVWWGLLPGGVPGPGGGLPGLGGVVSGPGGLPVPGGGGVSAGLGGYIPACTEADTPPADRQTPVKLLPWPNFVAAGNNQN